MSQVHRSIKTCTLPRLAQTANVCEHHDTHSQLDGAVGVYRRFRLILRLTHIALKMVGVGEVSACKQHREVALVFLHHSVVVRLVATRRAYKRHHVVATLLRFASQCRNVFVLVVHGCQREEHGVEESGRNVLVVLQHQLLHRLRCRFLLRVFHLTIYNAMREGVEERAHQSRLNLILIYFLCHQRSV